MILGQWCQVPGAGPSLCSPLRAFVGSSDKLVRGAGRRLPPNRLSQKGAENERRGGVEVGELQARQLCGKWGRGGPHPALKGSIPQDPLRWCPFHRAPKEPWTEGKQGPRSKETRIQGEAPGSPYAFLVSPTVGCLSTYCVPGTGHLAPRPPPDPSPLDLT